MKKRIISLLMTFCMAFSLMPMSSARIDSEETEAAEGGQQAENVPVYVYAQLVYDGSELKEWITLGKLTPQTSLKAKHGWGYSKGSDEFEAIVNELSTERFVPHDAGVEGYLDHIREWASLVAQDNWHTGYKGENGYTDGKVLGYHLDGKMDVVKVTFRYNNGTATEQYFPKNTAAIRPAKDPTDDSKWFLGWYTENDTPYDFSTSLDHDITLTAKWTDEQVPVYVYAQTVYDDNGTLTPCTEKVEGVTHNANGYVTLGKMFVPLNKVSLGTSYDANKEGDRKTIQAVVSELQESFVPHDETVADYLGLVDGWANLRYQNSSHDGYKGENPGDPHNGSVKAYHLDGAIVVRKVTFRDENGDILDERYYPESNPRKTITVKQPPDPINAGKWFLGWYTENDTLYDFNTPVGREDITLTAKWRSRTPDVVPDVSTVMLRVQDVNAKHAHGTADYRLSTADGNGETTQVNGEYIYTFTVTDPADFVSRYSTAERGTHRLAGEPDCTIVWKWGRDGWVCQNHDLGLVNGEMASDAPIAVVLDAECPFTVTFDPDNGQAAATQQVYSGEKAVSPADPTHPDSKLKFAGWYLDGEKYAFDTPVTDDITLTAEWGREQGEVKLPYSIEYYVEDGNGDYVLARTDRTHSAPAGTSITLDESELTAPDTHHIYDAERSRETIHGIVTRPTVEDGEVVGLLTLKVYCKWDSHTVSFNGNGGTDTASVQVKHGQTVSAPADPTRSGYRFNGWYSGAAAYDFSQPVTEDLELTAQWPRRSNGGSTRYAVTVEESGNGSAASSHKSAASGTTVTLTATPDAGYTVKALTVTVNSTGKNVKLTDKGGGSFTFTMPAGAVTVKAIFVKDNHFTDVPDDSYYKDAVDWAEKNGITGGVSADAFRPDRICTRAQAVTFLWRTAGSPEPETTEMPFTDVPAGSYYFKAVLWAVENGITRGTTDTTFSPDMTCSRSHIVTFLWRAAGSPAPDSGNPFTDVPAGVYYTEAVLWAVENGITRGITETTFSPAQGCTRAQIVTFLYRQSGMTALS